MKGYVIFYVEQILDPAQLKAYQQAAHPTLVPHGGRVIIGYGRQEPVEGDPVVGVVTVEFPSYESARAWYHSGGYQSAKALRADAARCRAVIVEGRA
ncbi:MAG: DUF1330 domain-containing protein [Steroidobacteraceae bacterium]